MTVCTWSFEGVILRCDPATAPRRRRSHARWPIGGRPPGTSASFPKAKHSFPRLFALLTTGVGVPARWLRRGSRHDVAIRVADDNSPRSLDETGRETAGEELGSDRCARGKGCVSVIGFNFHGSDLPEIRLDSHVVRRHGDPR